MTMSAPLETGHPEASHAPVWKAAEETKRAMSSPIQQPQISIVKTDDYREGYANSVQIRVSVWDFLLMFGTMTQTTTEAVQIANFQGIYLSPQQAKALLNILQQNIAQYEATFGELRLEAQPPGSVIQ